MTTGTIRARPCWLGALACLALLCATADVQAQLAPVQPKAGEVPPDDLGTDTDGNRRTVGGHRGKVLIVTFWASWCGPCRRELPMLAKVQQAVGRQHLEVIAVNMKEDRKTFNAVRRANSDFDLTYVHDMRGGISNRYGVTALPNMFIIDRDGKVAHVHRGYSEDVFDSFVKEMLALLPPEALAAPAGG